MSMLMRLPKHVPPLSVILQDIGRPKPEALAKALGVHKRTVYHWLAKDEAPMPVLLALFWLTRWGMQWVDADLYNEAQLHFAMNSCQARKIRDLKGKLRRTAKLANFGSANDPSEDVELPLPRGVNAVYMHKKRADLPGPTKIGRKVDPLAPGLIRERVCQPTVGYQHFVQKKRREA